MPLNARLLSEIALNLPEIQMPVDSINHDAWAVVACDQYSSEPSYWEKVADYRRGKPSTFDLIFPEAYLHDDPQARIRRIYQNMKEYQKKGCLQNKGSGWVYVQRKTRESGLRQGLVLAIDLEQYDFSPGSNSLIRPTEGTILERLPIRIQSYEHAIYQLPHVMLLINDPNMEIIEGLHERTEIMEEIYDFELMLGGGRLTGHWLDNTTIINETASSLQKLLMHDRQYNENAFLFAVGDGNHSLAAAKSVWKNLRSIMCKGSASLQDHPARYALVEVINIHSPGLRFEPIHRCIFNIASDKFFSFLRQRVKPLILTQSATQENLASYPNGALFFSQRTWYLLEDAGETLACGLIDKLFEEYQIEQDGSYMDYIHGWDEAKGLAEQTTDRIAIFFNVISREDFFPHITAHGSLPRKAFSMGDANEKRYYFESRLLQY